MDQTLASGLRMSRKYDHLLSLHHLAEDEIVTVKANCHQVLNSRSFGILDSFEEYLQPIGGRKSFFVFKNRILVSVHSDLI
jgi:hypothetical protein